MFTGGDGMDLTDDNLAYFDIEWYQCAICRVDMRSGVDHRSTCRWSGYSWDPERSRVNRMIRLFGKDARKLIKVIRGGKYDTGTKSAV